MMPVTFNHPWLLVVPCHCPTVVVPCQSVKLPSAPAIACPLGSLVSEDRFTVDPGVIVETLPPVVGSIVATEATAFVDVVKIVQFPSGAWLNMPESSTSILLRPDKTELEYCPG